MISNSTKLNKDKGIDPTQYWIVQPKNWDIDHAWAAAASLLSFSFASTSNSSIIFFIQFQNGLKVRIRSINCYSVILISILLLLFSEGGPLPLPLLLLPLFPHLPIYHHHLPWFLCWKRTLNICAAPHPFLFRNQCYK